MKPFEPHPPPRKAFAAPRSRSVAVDARMIRSSGIGTYLREVLSRLVEQQPQRRFHLLGPPALLEPFPWTRAPNVRVVPFDAPIYSVREQLLLPKRAPAEASVFWAPHYNAPILFRGKLVVTIHDVCHLALAEASRGLLRRTYARVMFAALARRAQAVLTVSRFSAAELARWTAIDPARVTIAPNGVSESWFQAPARERPTPEPYLLFVGNVKPHKNLARLIRAFGSIVGTIPHSLLIVGQREGFLTPDGVVEHLARPYGERVRFTGFLPEEDLRNYYAHADALVFPSLYEGFGLPALEAMASGCPVVAARAAALPEVCGDAALYFDPLDEQDIARQLLRILNDEHVRAEFRQRGPPRAKQFSWSNSAGITLGILEEEMRS